MDIPVREFFETMTNSAKITSHRVEVPTYTDGSGRLCVSSETPVTVTYEMLNPQRFSFSTATNMSMKFAGLASGYSTVDMDKPSISQKSDSLLTVTYPVDFLLSLDKLNSVRHGDMGASINIKHPVSKEDFGTYTNSLYCNSKPPAVTAPTVYINQTSNTYVVAFNLPEKNLMKQDAVHSDISTISVNGYSFQVSIDSSGTVSSTDPNFFGTSILSAPSNIRKNKVSFDVGTYPVYYQTDDPLSPANNPYTVSLTDNAGLFSESTTWVNSMKLGSPTLTDNQSQIHKKGVAATFSIGQDEDLTYSTFTLSPPTTAIDEDANSEESVSGVSVSYIVQNSNGTRVKSGSASAGSSCSFNLGCGTFTVTVTSSRHMYVSSSTTFTVTVKATNLCVSDSGDDTDGDGSISSPYKTLAKAMDSFDTSDPDIVKNLILLGNVTSGSGTVSFNGKYKISGAYKIDGEDISVSGGEVEISRTNLASSLILSGGAVTLDSLVAESLSYNGGSLLLCGSTKVGEISIASSGSDLVGTVAVDSSFTGSATITPAVYSVGLEVLSVEAGEEVTQSLCNKFTVTNDTSGGNPVSYVLVPNSAKDKGVLSQPGIYSEFSESGYTMSVAGASAFSTAQVSAGSAKVAWKLSDADDNTVADTETALDEMTAATIQLYSNGSAVGSLVTKTDGKTPSLTLPTWLPEGTYSVRVTATIGMYTYSADFAIRVKETKDFADITEAEIMAMESSMSPDSSTTPVDIVSDYTTLLGKTIYFKTSQSNYGIMKFTNVNSPNITFDLKLGDGSVHTHSGVQTNYGINFDVTDWGALENETGDQNATKDFGIDGSGPWSFTAHNGARFLVED